MKYHYHLPDDPPPRRWNPFKAAYRYYRPRKLPCPEYDTAEDAIRAFTCLPLTSDNLLIYQTILHKQFGQPFDSLPLLEACGFRKKIVTYSRKKCPALTHTITILGNGRLLRHQHRKDKTIIDADGIKVTVKGGKDWVDHGGCNYLYPCGDEEDILARVPRKDEWGIPINTSYHLEVEAALSVLCWGAGFTDGKRVYVPKANGPCLIDVRDQKTLLTSFVHLAKELVFIHAVGAHRDIKPDNAVIHNEIAHWVDFGFFTADKFITQSRGTPHYVDPTLHRKICTEGATKEEAQAGDIWAFGITMWILLNPEYGMQPFRKGVALEELIHTPITQFKAPDTPLNNLIKDMLTLPLDKRPKSAEVLSRLNQAVNTLINS